MKRKLLFITGSLLVVFTVFLTLILPQLSLGLQVGYEVVVQDDFAYISDNEGVDIINIADPRDPTKIAEVQSPDGAFGISITNDYLFIASDSDGLEIIDINDPANAVKIGEYNDGGSIVDVEVEGGYAYSIDSSNGVEILNVT
ncbi:MAG: LVIVD repeat-containing protein, partial [Candidatus Hodarchaeales archaeon]